MSTEFLERKFWAPGVALDDQAPKVRRSTERDRARVASPPQVLEPAWRQLGVTHCGLDRAMPEIGLQRSCVCPLIGQSKARRMTQHVWVDLEGQLGLDACTLDKLLQAGNRERRATLRHEDEGRLGLAVQGSQSSQFITQQRMRCCCPALGSTQVQIAGLKLDVTPLQATHLRGPEAMSEGQEDHGGVPLAPAVALGGLDQLLNLTLGQMLARP